MSEEYLSDYDSEELLDELIQDNSLENMFANEGLSGFIDKFSTFHEMDTQRQSIVRLTLKSLEKVMETTGNYSNVLLLLNKLLEVNITESSKWEAINDKLKETAMFVDRINDLDTNFQEYLHRTKNTNEIIPDADMQQRLNDIEEDSLIIYIKKAQLYKVYKSDTLEEFQHDESTHYHRAQYGPVYEVVRDEHPQKVMIVVAEDIKDDRINELKQHIIEFVRKNPVFADAAISDLKAYSNNNKTEFVISSIRLPNITAKERFIEAFIKFMYKKGQDAIADKIQIRMPEPLELEGVRFYKLPTNKESLDNSNINNLLDQLISTVSISQTPVVINLNINSHNTINNSNSNNMALHNSRITYKNTDSSTKSKKTLKTFFKFICDTKPSWYLEGKLVELTIIENAYRDYFNDKSTSTAIISKNLKDKLYNYSTRTHNIARKQLVSFKTLQKFF